jgi:hypothetical protein
MVFITLSCQTKSIQNDQAFELYAQSVKGSETLSTYKSESKVEVFDKGKLAKKYTDTVEFKIDRRTINVSEKGDIQFRIVTTDKTGNIELKDLAYPEPGQELYEMIDKYGKPLVVKDIPIGSLYYVARVSLPKDPVKVGDTWNYRARWISEATGWPFEIALTSKLKSWSDCEGLMCAIIEFTGEVILPEDFPLKATLASKIKGIYHYSPVSFEVLWGESQSVEEFYIGPIDKKIKVKSKSCSSKEGYKKKCKI